MLKRVLVTALALALVASAVSTAFATEVSVRAGAASAGAAVDSRSATSAFVGVSVSLTRWFALGAEAERWDVCAPGGIVTVPEVTARFDRSQIVTAAVTSRFQPPLRAPFLPFATLETGWARERWGDLHLHNEFYGPRDTTIPGSRHAGLYSALGVGIASQWPRPWPRLEGSLRFAALSGPDATELRSARLAVAF